MPNPDRFRYRDANGIAHQVLARKRRGVWEVLDKGGEQTIVVERLAVFEGAKEANAIAREYASHHHHRSQAGKEALRTLAAATREVGGE